MMIRVDAVGDAAIAATVRRSAAATAWTTPVFIFHGPRVEKTENVRPSADVQPAH
jgi:hypothetical protein